jgi:photosystem II stability/assembly factor-like uncharacterized protein
MHVPSILRFSFFVFGLAFCFHSFGQQVRNPLGVPATLPMPSWVQLTDWGHPNVYKIDSLIAVYKNSHLKQNASQDPEEFHEDPYLTAYLRWRGKMSPFIQPDGTIAYDADYYKNQLHESLKGQRAGTDRTASKTTASANWTVLGPTETYRQGGALATSQVNIYCMAIATSNTSVLYAGSEPGTLFRSADKGLNWISVTDTLSSCTANSIAIHPRNENVVYVYDATSDALLKTTSGGVSWSVLSSYTGRGGNATTIHPRTGRVCITGASRIYYSDDSGTTWSAASGSNVTGTLYDMVLHPRNGDTVYAVGNNSADSLVLLRSTNGGASFSNVTTSAVARNTTTGARLGVSPATSNTVYCISLGLSTSPYLLKSTDGGGSWAVAVRSSSTGLAGSMTTTGLGMSNGQGFYDLAIVVSPADASNVIVGTTTTYKSTDGGSNFSPLGGYGGSFPLHPDLQCAVANGSDAYLATDGGVNYSTDFYTNLSNWVPRNKGLRSSDFWGFGQGWDQDIVVGGRYHNGNTAIVESYSSGNAMALGGGEDATGHVYHGHNSSTGFRDIGNLKVPPTLAGTILYNDPDIPNTMWPQDNYYGLFSSKLVTDPRYSNVFYLGKDSLLWKSTNRGASYNVLHNFGDNNSVWRFEIARSNSSVIYVCARNGVYRTANSGVTWARLTLPATWRYYNSDIAINPLNENEVYVCMAQGSATDKVFRSTDGGSSWTNITGSALNGKAIAYVQYHGGTNSGLYAITNSRPARVYYRDGGMSDWTAFSSGLPANIEARVGALIFYRDNKMRLAGNGSVWESPLYATGAPIAQPMADRQYVGCTRDTVNFFDYSMVTAAGATRTWAFSGASWVSSTTAAQPKVLYPGPGYYRVALTVTNAAGQVHTRTIDSMIYVSDDHCSPDTVAGRCIQLNGTSQTVNLGTANINSNNFSISCWVQPKGVQSSFSQLVGHAAYPGSGGYGFGMGFSFSGYTRNLILCYTDSIVNYSNYSSLVCDSTKWNYVVLTYSPRGVVMYLNGIADTVNSGFMPPIDLSRSPFVLNLDVHNGQGSRFNGKIDEVKFYNYALSQEEVREKMHLIPNTAIETGLIKYYQFNQYDMLGGRLYDLKNNFSVPVPAEIIVTSSAPVATGRVLRMPMVNTAGLNDLSAADVKLHLPASGTYPDGEVVAFHLFSNPDTKPDRRPTEKGYFVLNNYGPNATFTQPDSLILSRLWILYPGYTAGNFRLYKRASGDFGNTWGRELDSAVSFRYAPYASTIAWARPAITSMNSQLLIVNNDTTYYNTQINSAAQQTLQLSSVYPNPCRDYLMVDVQYAISGTTKGTFTISTIAGATVLQLQNDLQAPKTTTLIPLPRLAAGTYLLTVSAPGTEPVGQKFVVE